jgi:hypothetical protein
MTERERKKIAEIRGWGWFLAYFGPNFLHFWPRSLDLFIRSESEIFFSLIMPNPGLWFSWKGSQLLVQSMHCELSNL